MRKGLVKNKRMRRAAVEIAGLVASGEVLDPAQVFTNPACLAWFDGKHLWAQVWVGLTKEETKDVLRKERK